MNADKVVSGVGGEVLGNNLYSYCFNNPVAYEDFTGERAVSVFDGHLTGGGVATFPDLAFVGGIAFTIDIIKAGKGLIVDGIATSVGNVRTILDSKNESESKENNSKEKDSRLKGSPGEVKKEGAKETLIGPAGRASKERHLTDHGKPKYHSNPHDHDILWDDNGNPIFGPANNYWDETIPVFP